MSRTLFSCVSPEDDYCTKECQFMATMMMIVAVKGRWIPQAKEDETILVV